MGRASQIAGLHEIPVLIKDIDDEDVAIIALIENIQRENLSPIDEAVGYKKSFEYVNKKRFKVFS